MTEAIHNDYEVSSGPMLTWEIPYARLTDATPTPTNPAEVTDVLIGSELTGTIISIDAANSVAVINFAPGAVYLFTVRNVLTYNVGAEATWGAINIGDTVYYDGSATMPVGTYLSTSPSDVAAAANSRFGHVVPASDADMALFPKGGAGVASTQSCAVMQRGAGA